MLRLVSSSQMSGFLWTFHSIQELSELAISTFKHIGRIRSARFIGIDLANFYLLLGQIPQAVTFLLDALKSYQAEGWRLLELQTLRDIAKCYRDVQLISDRGFRM